MKLIERTLQILTILSNEYEGLSVSSIAKKINIPSSSTHRILSTLKKNNFIIQDLLSKRYKIGYKVLTLSKNIIKQDTLIQISRSHMKQLALKIDKTVALCVLDSLNVICIDYIENKDSKKFYIRIGLETPSYSTSAGKTIHAYLDVNYVKEIFSNSNIEKITSYTKTNIEDYLEDLVSIKENGYGICNEELQLGIEGVACPIFDCDDKVIACISFTALKIENSINEESINALKECVNSISKELGGKY